MRTTFEPLRFVELTEPLGAEPDVCPIGSVEGVGTTYSLYVIAFAPLLDDGEIEWRHEYVAVISPPSPVFGCSKRSQSYASNAALLAAVGADIDSDLRA